VYMNRCSLVIVFTPDLIVRSIKVILIEQFARDLISLLPNAVLELLKK